MCVYGQVISSFLTWTKALCIYYLYLYASAYQVSSTNPDLVNKHSPLSLHTINIQNEIIYSFVCWVGVRQDFLYSRLGLELYAAKDDLELWVTLPPFP